MPRLIERLLPRHLHWLIGKKGGQDPRAFSMDIPLQPTQELDIYPTDQSIRAHWFSLTAREREVVALICMGYKNYEVASNLGIEYGTVQTHLQNIFHKFNLRSRGEIRKALTSWPAEEWWKHHHN